MASRQAGFSLVEVLIASVIMIVGVFGVMAVFPQTLRSTKQSGRMSVLSQLAIEKMEQLRSRDLSDADLLIGTHPPKVDDSTSQKYYPVPGFPEEYSLRWVVTAGPSDGAGNAEAQMRSVAVEATYRVRYIGVSSQPDYGTDSLELTSSTFVTD